MGKHDLRSYKKGSSEYLMMETFLGPPMSHEISSRAVIYGDLKSPRAADHHAPHVEILDMDIFYLGCKKNA